MTRVYAGNDKVRLSGLLSDGNELQTVTYVFAEPQVRLQGPGDSLVRVQDRGRERGKRRERRRERERDRDCTGPGIAWDDGVRRGRESKDGEIETD